MKEVYLLLGSNEGNREENLANCRKLIEFRCGEIINVSPVYETEAWGMKDQNSFLNQALAVRTGLSPTDLLAALKSIEKETGRKKTVRWGPRIIDIDILFYSNEVFDLPGLIIPHPYLHERRFTLMPLNEISAEFVHPVLHKTIKVLLNECSDTSTAIKLTV